MKAMGAENFQLAGGSGEEVDPSYVDNVFVQNVACLRKYAATQDMSDMSQTCRMAFFNVA